MGKEELGISQKILDTLDETYLKWTLKEIPSSPMMPQGILDELQNKYLDLTYDTKSNAQKLDLYLPPEATAEHPVPLIVYIHGGGFMAGDKRDMQFGIFLGALNHGYALASINYRLSKEAQFPEPVQDCKAAVRYLKAIAPQYYIDPSRFAAVGNSAGGYMALMIATSPNIPLLEDFSTGHSAYGTDVRCCIATYPVIDFSLIDDQKAIEGVKGTSTASPNSPESLFMGSCVRNIPSEIIQAASPAHYITPQMPPVMIKAGTADTIVPHAQSLYFANRAKLIAGDEKVDFELVPGANHHDPAFKRPAFLKEALAFLDTYMK